MNLIAVLSLVGILFLPGPPLVYKNCHNSGLCLQRAERAAPQAAAPRTPRRSSSTSGSGTGRRSNTSNNDRRGDGGANRSAAPDDPGCTARRAGTPAPDVAQMDMGWPQGRVVSETGDGPVITGMETEFRYVGPRTFSWTQTGRPGLTEDCEVVPGVTRTFTAQLTSLVWDFEQGSPAQQMTTGNRVTHRYDELSDEGGYTVCAYAVWQVPGSAATVLTLVADLDHEVQEIRSTLVQ